jgi:hypothetical protein
MDWPKSKQQQQMAKILDSIVVADLVLVEQIPYESRDERIPPQSFSYNQLRGRLFVDESFKLIDLRYRVNFPPEIYLFFAAIYPHSHPLALPHRPQCFFV